MSTGTKDYQQLRADYRWHVPKHYNIAADVCDAREPDASAMIHEHHMGVVRQLHRGELQALSNQAANLLAGLGVENEGIAHRIQDSEPKVLITDAPNASRFEGLAGPRLVVLEASLLAAESDDFETVETLADDPTQLYSTGRGLRSSDRAYI
jgi:acetyl-CoA synthetase